MKPTRKSAPADGSSASPPAKQPGHWRSPAVLPAVMLILVGALVADDSVVALAYVLFDGSVALGVLAAATLAGMWLVPLLGLGHASWRDRLMLGAGLGIGMLSLLVFGLGVLGWLQTGPVVLVGVLAAAGLARAGLDIYNALHGQSGEDGRGRDARYTGETPVPHPAGETPVPHPAGETPVPHPAGETPVPHPSRPPTPDPRHPTPDTRPPAPDTRQLLALSGFHYLWLLAIPFLAYTLLSATLPPGFLWQEEAWGYDVLEYHLAVPKEFFEAGQIFFMPYNAYSNFPLNAGMLWLLMMVLRGDPIEAAFAAQLVNVGLAVLFVAAAWWTGRLYSQKAGVTAGVLAAATPWVAYLAGIAYVEPGMLAMGMLALGAMLRAAHVGSPGQSNRVLNLKSPFSIALSERWVIAAGLLAGFACGYKYTAVPLIAAPLGVVPLLTSRSWAQPLRRIGLFAVAALLVFSPWLIRNVVNTGNPVFPLAYSVFGAKPGVWDDVLEERWQRGHGMEGAALEDEPSMIRVAFERTLLEPRTGMVLVLLAAVGAVRRRDRLTLAALAMLAVQIIIWLAATHLFSRFAVVILIPLLWLAARAAEELRWRLSAVLLALVLTAGAGWNLYHLAGLYYIHTRVGAEMKSVTAHGQVEWFVTGSVPGFSYLKIINQLESGSRVMFVGEARTFYVRTPRDYAVVFSRHPLGEAVERILGPADPLDNREKTDYQAVIRWLADRGVTHVLVHWLEMKRLRETYGFEPRLTRELFDNLESAGMSRVGGGDFLLADQDVVYATLYEVPHE